MVAQFSAQATPTRRRPTLLAVPTPAAATAGTIALVQWPEDREGAEILRALGRPRLLLVAADAPAPTVSDLGEDWIRLPASDEDVEARAAALAARAATSVVAPDVPPSIVVGDGRLVHRGEWAALSPIEEGLAAAMVARFGELVPLDALASGPDGQALSANAIRVHVMRLRKRIKPLGLVVRTLHGRGYLIELDV